MTTRRALTVIQLLPLVVVALALVVALYLDDPIAFAHELFSLLAAAGDPRILDAAGVAEQEGGATVAHASGIEFGIAAEALRRSLLASAAGPRIPWQPASS